MPVPDNAHEFVIALSCVCIYVFFLGQDMDPETSQETLIRGALSLEAQLKLHRDKEWQALISFKTF